VKYFYLFMLGLIVGISVGGYVAIRVTHTSPSTPGEPEYEVIRIPETCHQYKEAFNSKIGMTVEQVGECLHVSASDTYKRTRQTFCYERPRNYYGLGVGYGTTGPGVSLDYMRRVYKELWIGGSVIMSRDPAVYIKLGTTGL